MAEETITPKGGDEISPEERAVLYEALVDLISTEFDLAMCRVHGKLHAATVKEPKYKKVLTQQDITRLYGYIIGDYMGAFDKSFERTLLKSAISFVDAYSKRTEIPLRLGQVIETVEAPSKEKMN